MRTTLDIPEELIEEAMKASGARTKTLAVCLALQDMIKNKQMQKVLEYRGKIDIDNRATKTRSEWEKR